MNEDHNSGFRRRLHLTKEQRLPKCYKEVEKIVKSVKACQTNFKTALARSRLRGSQFKKVYKLSLNVLKYYNYIQKIIDKAELLIKEKFLRREIASILIYELIFGNGTLPGESKAVSTVQAYQNDLLNIHQDLQSHNTDFTEFYDMYVPRYVRVHTLLTTVSCVIKDLENYGFMQVLYDVDISEEKFFELVRSLENGHFLVDFHFKDILVFVQDENLIQLDLYKNGHIFLQDKASYIPVHVLNPEPGSTVIDACAAPGMKSAHLASKMKNKGILIACERDQSRFETLKETMKYGAVKISKTLCTDFKLIDPYDEAYSTVEYILLDPSCSGSGMVNRMDSVTDTEDSKTKDRLIKLSGFQIILLKHALKFPSVKRVVYSTCSVHEEENEYVVHEALNAFNGTFKLVPVLPDYFERGSENYEFGKMCLRTIPEKHLTNGFFTAVFERINPHEHHERKFSIKKSKYETNFKRLEDLKKYKKNKTEEFPMDNIIKNNDNFSRACQEKEYSNLQQCPSFNKNYDSQSLKQYKKFSNSSFSGMPHKVIESNMDYNLNDGMPYRNYAKKTKEQRIPEFTVQKKKEKNYSTDIELKFDKQNQEELVHITTSKLPQNCENSEEMEEPPKMYNAANEISNNSTVKEKTKYEKHQNSENISEIVEGSSKILSDFKLKHKKRKKEHSTSTYYSSFTESHCDEYHLVNTQHQTAENNQNFNQNTVNAVHGSCAEESRELKMPEFSNRQKTDKGCTIKFQSDKVFNPKEKPKASLSESLQNWETSEVGDKKPKHKNKFILENNLEITGCLETTVDSILSHKKKRRKREHSEHGSIHIYGQESQPLNPEEKSKAAFSDILQNWVSPEVGDKKPKHKKKFSLENNPGNLETSVGSSLNHEKKGRKVEDSGNECIDSYSQENEPLNEINSSVSKPEVIKNPEFMLSSSTQLDKSLCENKYSFEITLKVKKHKHKKHSKKYITSSDLNNLLVRDLAQPQCDFECHSLVKDADNLNNVPESKDTTINKQYLADSFSKSKKNKKHESHANKTSESNETKNYFSCRNTDCTSTVELNKESNEKVAIHTEIDSVDSSHQDHCHIKKKRKKNKKNDLGFPH